MKKLLKALFIAGLLCQTQSVEAAGFYLSEQSVSGMGTAFASNTAGAIDATTVYTNPAGMTSMCRPNDFVAGLTYLIPNSKYHDRGTINAAGNPMRSRLVCGPCGHNTNGGQIGKNAWVPYISYVKKFGCRWAAGLSINAPFGLSTDYNDEWYGRYYATYSEIITTNINASLAYDITDCLTIGAGLNACYGHLENKNLIDFGAIIYNQTGGQVAGFLEQLDGKAHVKGCAWAFGANVGLLYKFNCDRTRIGIQYRSQLHFNINNGHVSYKNVPNLTAPPINFQPIFSNGGMKSKVTLPDIVSIGLMHRWNNCLTLYADAQWTNWRTLQQLKLTFKNPPPSLQEASLPLKWKSVWRIAVGAKYDVGCNMALRIGYMYDKSPVRNSYYTSPRVPDSDRQMVACGLQYWASDCISFDLGYAHTFFNRSHVNKTPGIASHDPNVVNAGGLKGRWRTFADLIGAQIHVSF